MIQRIQTLYLLITAGLLTSLYFNPLMTTAAGKIYYTSNTALTILITVNLALSVLGIVLYRNRILQMRVTMINVIAMLGLQGWIAYFFFTRAEGVAFSTSAVFPIVCVILSILAYIGIARDEAMVQSASRLRSSKKKK